jgi:gas vesicle protein
MKTHSQVYQHEHLGEHTSRAKPVLSGLLIGGLIGAGTALLFAPKSGERMRADIQNKTIELRDRTTDTVKDTVSQVKSKARQMTSDVIGQARDLTQQGKEALDDQYKKVSQTVNNGKKAIQGL